MGRASSRENKNIYHLCREKNGVSREKASELMNGITPERIEKIENEKSRPHPDEVLAMAEGYRAPELCNYYCANECPIGQQRVTEIKPKALPQIILEILASLNSMNKKQERLIEICLDGEVDKCEIEDFVRIQDELERMSVTVETLRLWSEQMLANGAIDMDAYNEYKRNK